MKKTPAQIVLIISALMLLIEPLGDGWLYFLATIT